MKGQKRYRKWAKWLFLAVAVFTVSVGSGVFTEADAMKLDIENNDWSARWDNSVKYNAGFRLLPSASELTADINLDDGNNNFSTGLISNRIDILSELDVRYDNFGVRLSGAAWYDDVYNQDTDNTSMTGNQVSVSSNEFTDNTAELHGKKAEILDAFAFWEFDLGSMPTVLRVGRHTLLYGESLFFGDNGIANGQAPLDRVKQFTVPSSQFKEVIRPVGQVSTQIQVTPSLTFSAYYQFEWQETRLPASGSYLSFIDILGEGAERFLAGPNPAFGHMPGANPWLAFYKGEDLEGDDNGQGGIMCRIEPSTSDIEYGLYLIRYHEKTPVFYLRPAAGPPNLATGNIGTFQQVYPENITAVGASFSTVLGDLNVAGETSYRFNQPLVSDPQVVNPGTTADNDDNALFARGQSFHAQISAIGFLKKTALWDGGSWMAEVACNQRMSTDENYGALDPNTDKFAVAFRGVFTMDYYQVFPSVDLFVPIGLGWNPYGKSSVIQTFNGGTEGGGDVSIGLKARYNYLWNFSINYINYFGEKGGFLTPPNNPAPLLSYDQHWADRDFITFTIERTF